MGGGWEADGASAACVITSNRCQWMVGGWEVDAACAVSFVDSIIEQVTLTYAYFWARDSFGSRSDRSGAENSVGRGASRIS
jgi:hypothetical protein